MATGAIVVPKVLFTGTAHRINIIVYSDSDWETRKDISGAAIKLLVKDTGGTLRTYTATVDDTGADDGNRGRAHVQLNSLYHTDAGDADAQLLEDDVPIQDYVLTFREKLS